MIKLQISTHEGKTYDVEVENYDPVETNQMLNDNQVHTVLFGDQILSRILVKEVIKITEEM